jgi:predicted secreted hydrolase
MSRSIVEVLAITALAVSPVRAADAGWEVARPGWQYVFPRDHGSHPAFKTEWWYFTGNLRGDDGREFGYQLTFFRFGVIPPAGKLEATSRFVVRNIAMVHFAVSDLEERKFHFEQLLSRGAYGEAGFGNGARLAWLDQCSLDLKNDGTFHLIGRAGGQSLDLTLSSAKPPVIHGIDGLSRKADGPGRASQYYSFTRLATMGTLGVAGRSHAVRGESWFDHEWATNQLGPDQVGWDWLSLQLDDGTDLMLFQIRKKGGRRDKWSSGTLVSADGKATHLVADEFALGPSHAWRSPATGAEYPEQWHISIPGRGIDLTATARMEDQELNLRPTAYWEGAISISGTRSGASVRGKGYLEMTGYAGQVTGLGGQ